MSPFLPVLFSSVFPDVISKQTPPTLSYKATKSVITFDLYIYISLSQLNLCNCQSNTFLTSLFRSWQQAPASIACDCSNCRYIYGCNNLEWKEIKKIIKHPKHVIHFKFVACDKVWYHVAKLNYWCFIFKNIYY